MVIPLGVAAGAQLCLHAITPTGVPLPPMLITVPAGHPPPTTDNCAGVADVVGMDFRVVNTFGCTVDQDSRPVRTALKASNVSIRAADCQKR